MPPPAVTLTPLSAPSPYARCDRRDPSVQRDAEVEPHLAVSPRDPRRLIAAWQQDRRTAGGAVVTADPRRPGVAYVAWHRGARTLLSRTEDAGATWNEPRAVQAFPGRWGT